TMQVLMARRKLEIATLKTLGYERRHLVLLFGLETGMLGLAGGLAGAAMGTGLAVWLRTLLGRMGPILLGPAVDVRVLAGGVAVGGPTAGIFGRQAIARASAVRPSTLLRDLPTPIVWRENGRALRRAHGALLGARGGGDALGPLWHRRSGGGSLGARPSRGAPRRRLLRAGRGAA